MKVDLFVTAFLFLCTNFLMALLSNYLDHTEANEEDGTSFEDNFAAEILDSLYEAGDN